MDSNKLIRPNVIPRVTRKIVDNIIEERVTLFGTERRIMTKVCTCCSRELIINNFYIKQNTQHIPSEYLTEKDFRTFCIDCHDEKRAINRQHRKQMLNKEVSKILDELSILTDQEYDRMLAIMQKERANRNLPVANLNSILFGDTDG